MAGLFFNKAADSCDYARNVICKKVAGAGTTAAASTTASTPAASAARTTTTTTTTTTEAPVEEEEEEEEEEVDDVEDGGQEDPEALKELLNLIKKLGESICLGLVLRLRRTMCLTCRRACRWRRGAGEAAARRQQPR